mmetsp:Transcript_7182/g.10323  ORF Transcript_7182/g.10323 Transcript_7182/m.10323 type:complete len:96 (-) Transcript_7182:178-465(-)
MGLGTGWGGATKRQDQMVRRARCRKMAASVRHVDRPGSFWQSRTAAQRKVDSISRPYTASAEQELMPSQEMKKEVDRSCQTAQDLRAQNARRQLA